MKIGYIQYDAVHDARQNIAYVKTCLEQGTWDLVVLPELSLCGYLFESREALSSYAENVPSGVSTQRMMDLSRQHRCTLIFGLAEKEGDRLFNTAVVVSKGRYMGKYRKIHLSDFEKTLFDRGTENRIFEVDGIHIGVQICFDLWFPEVSREQIRMGADILCAPANFGGETTCQVARVRAIENVVPLVLCNRVGSESMPGMQADFLGKSTVVTASGQCSGQAPAHLAYRAACEVAIPCKRGNVICSDFDREMAFHYAP